MSKLNEFSSISELSQALHDKKLSATELAQDTLAAIKSYPDNKLFLHIDEGLSLEQAKQADAMLANGSASALTGIPIAHKDLFVTKGWRTTAASKMLANYISPFNATVVEKLLQAGSVNMGKLSCDEFAMGSGNENSAFGAVKNPWDNERIPGGSSGGSAAAVAAGLLMGATGTDTGGSVRQPAAYCGVSGIKPTYGTISRYGIIAYASSLDQAGPLAHSAADLALLLDSMSGFDPQDSTSLEYCDADLNAQGRILKDFQAHQAQGDKPLKGLRIGVPAEFFNAGLADDVASAVDAAIKQFEALGATRVDISLPNTHLSIPAYYVIAPAEASSNLSRYDGVRYGHRASEYTDLFDMTSKSRAEGFGEEVRRRILVGTYVLSHGYYDAYYLQAQKVRRMIIEDFQRVLKDQCDVIMGPVTPNIARTIGVNDNDPIADWLSDIYTLGVSLAGLPGMSIPCGLGGPKHNLPIGLQIIGNYFNEGQILAIADTYQQHTNWHQRKPGQA